jgi:D-3-phosphoglycerate dehydrogenase
MKTIVIPDDFPPVISGTPAFERLKELGDVYVYTTPPQSAGDLIQRIRDADVVLNIRAYCKFTQEVLQNVPRLRLISVWGTGTDHIVLSTAIHRGITVTNTPNTATEAVAEHALTLMLSVARQIPQIDREVRRGNWVRGLVIQLYGKTLGLIGTGLIGQQLARLAQGIGMKTIAWTLHPSAERAKEIGLRYVSFEELLTSADVISIHTHLTEKTWGLIGRKEFALMKPSAILINTARGAIVEKGALLEALRNKKIAGAGLDVFEKEPLDPDDPLLKLDNVILTPHSAGQTPEVVERGLQMAVDNIIRFWEGNPQNVVV